MGRGVRIVCYAVNGGGVGHLMRLVAVARWLRRYAEHAGARPEIVFLTTSEADGALFAERFASFKMPSKTAAREASLDKIAYAALAKQWVWHSVALLRPDLFVVDTFPQGSFHELTGCLDLCRKKAFVYRPIKAELAARPEFQSVLALYDLVIVPEERAALPVPPAVAPRVRAVGPIAVRERVEMLSREEARKRLDLPDDAFVVLASAGGGGDPGAEADLDAILRAFDGDEATHLVVTAGPLHRGPPRFGPRLRWLTGLGSAELLRAADVAVCSAGYNSFTELMLAGVPAVFVPQDKIADEQGVRAGRASEAGAAVVLHRPLEPAVVRRAVDALRDPARRRAAAEAAAALVASNGARAAARDLLRLVVPAGEVDAAAAAFGDDVLTAARKLGLPESAFTEVMRLLDPVDDGLPGLDPAGASAEAVRFLAEIAERAIPVSDAVRVSEQVLRRAPGGEPAERARACLRILGALAPFGDWAGASALLRIAATDRHASPEALGAEIEALAADLRRRGEDLYRGIERLVRRPARERGGSAVAVPAGADHETNGAADRDGAEAEDA